MKNIFLHLRLPFSFFLLPIFLFALSQSLQPNAPKAWWVFFILHFLLFPSSNAYNSYYDKDEGSIGLLENPPPVSKELLYTAWIFDFAAITLGFLFVTNWFLVYLVAYILISRAYSHPVVRLKKYPIVSWLLVTFFQGALTYLAVYEAVSGGTLDAGHSTLDVGQWTVDSGRWTLDAGRWALDSSPFSNVQRLISNVQTIPALICTSNLLAIYPITQVYQHAEDARRGDLTMSRILGIRGTFINAAVWLGLSGLGFLLFFENKLHFVVLAAFLLPLLAFFSVWMWRVWQNETAADFRSTMRMSALASVCLNAFFGILYFLNHT